MERHHRLHGVNGIQAGFQLLPESIPRLWKFRRKALLKFFPGQHLAGCRVNEMGFPHKEPFFFFIVIGQALYHGAAGSRNHHRILAMVQVAVSTHLFDAPSAPEHCRHHTVHRLNRSLGVGRVRKFEIVAQKVIYHAGDVLGVVQIPLDKILSLLLPEGGIEQLLPLLEIPNGCPHTDGKLMPPLFVRPEIFIRRAVPLLAIFTGKHQHLIAIAVIKAAGIGDDVVNICIPRLIEALNFHRFAGIQTDSILLLIQLELYNIQSGHPVSRFCFQDLRLHLLVFPPAILLPFFHFIALVKGMAHFTGKLNAHCIRFPVDAHNRIDHLDGLGHRPTDNRVGYLVNIIEGKALFLLASFFRAVVLIYLPASLVIAHSLLQKRNEFAHCTARKLSVFRERKGQQRFIVLLRDSS